MGLRFQATVLLSALLPSVLATGTFEEQCAIPSGIGGVIGDTCNPLALSETVSDAATVTSFSKRDGELTTFTTWPDATLVPVTTYVPVPQASLIPCTAWFFWICSEWDSAKGDIGGWQLALPPGVYPPGPPEFELPDGFDFDGDLPSWPALTIGTDNIPTFSSRPTSCETTQTATLYISTTSYAVSISSSATVTSTVTTTTSVIDTSSVILGCEAEPSSTSTPTMPTLTPTSTAVLTTLPITPVSDSSCVSTVTTSVCAIPSQPCQPSLSCAEWTATASSSSSTSTPESTPIPTSTTETTVASTSTTSSAASPTATWHFTMWDTKCGEETKDNYYSLQGYGTQSLTERCINLKEGLPQTSDTEESCQFFNEGGTSGPQPCTAGTFWQPKAFSIRGGMCSVYPERDCDGGYPDGYSATQYKTCIDLTQLDSYAALWMSMKCFAFTD